MKNVEDDNMSWKKLLGIIFLIFPSLFFSFLAFFSIKFETHPSSTSAIGYLFLPVIAVIAIVPGYILRFLGKYIGEVIDSKTAVKPFPKNKAIAFLFISCAIIISIAAYIAHRRNDIYNEKMEPRVLIENKQLIKQDSIEFLNELDLENWKFTDNRHVFAEEFSTKIIEMENEATITIRKNFKYSFWNGQKVFLCHDDSYAYILNQGVDSLFSIIVKQEIQLSSYVSNIKGFEIDFNNKKYFALLTVLRATLNRSVLTIYSTEGGIIYQELTGRIRVIKPVEINNKNYLITGRESKPEYVYFWE